ncbi:cytochrome c-type biogenesis protein [Commensalibacter oyaizuii]|uniref:Cytochrome c-type biogenesis protein n=1 Tax=Commensalibacter oyaizuii TaxID=3043873 RepID=A0ABT6PY87_9PROT|nr:cytochrome c-type biogenesis protein [Commensalibacter sp. TBRC 16381]MDI2089827.1 cytochrome c-type biogenesis protein CcmH [Commensalibacter sp. TBRC 16381]
MRPWFIFLLLGSFYIIPLTAHAVDSPDEMLSNPTQEKRAQTIGSQLRCLVCQNESIEDSSAELAKDLRKIVRQRVAAGDTNQQVIQWMVDRYGNFIRLKPPFMISTALLWAMPFLALIIGCLIAFVTLRQKKSAPPAPLNPKEKERLVALTKDQ